jgi:CMP/dCMP kinase
VSEPIVTLTGPPGSGKSTAGRLAAARLGLEYVSAGDLFRAEAARRGLSLEAFSKRAEASPELDRALDAQMVALADPARFLEGRITGALLRRRGVPTLYLVVTAQEDVRIARLAERDHQSVEEATRATRAREASERDRYRRYYGIDLADEPADLTVDSSEQDAAAVAGALAGFVARRRGSAP